MAGKRIFGRSLTICAVVLGLAAAAAPASAQTGGMKGKVVDAQNKPVDGATVTLVQADTNSKFTVKSKKGEFMQIGLPPGNYTVTAEKDGLKQTSNVRVSLDMAETTSRSSQAGPAPPMTKEEAAKAAGQDGGPQDGVLRRCGAQQRRQVRRGDRQVQPGARRGAEVHRVLHQHRRDQWPEEGLRASRR